MSTRAKKTARRKTWQRKPKFQPIKRIRFQKPRWQEVIDVLQKQISDNFFILTMGPDRKPMSAPEIEMRHADLVDAIALAFAYPKYDRMGYNNGR